jgi:beta-glucosidase
MKKTLFMIFGMMLVLSYFNKSYSQIYLDPNAKVEDRVSDLLSRMTLNEKLDYIGGENSMYIRAIELLSIPQIKMSDGPVGVRTWGQTTAFPAGICSSASFDVDLVNKLGDALGKDARARGVHFLLGPGLNIYRAPMCGRNFEYFGEDPYLSSRMAVAYVKGVQSHSVVSTIKHFAANNQEWNRYSISSDIDERTLQEIYLPAFKAAVKEANAGAVMSAYNLLNGTYCSQNHHLLVDILKNSWKFNGLVMSDWGATHEGVAAANGGLDLEMPAASFMNAATLNPAIITGVVKIATIDDKVRRILRDLFAFGFFDHNQTDTSYPLDNPDNAAVALDLAREGIVLLKNENKILPLKRDSVKNIAVIGPNADSYVSGGGSSYTSPFHSVSVLQGIKNLAGQNITITYASGLTDPANSYSTSLFYADSLLQTPGLNAEYFTNIDLTGTPAYSQIDAHIDFNYGSGGPSFPGFPTDNFSIRWTGFIQPATTGNYEFIGAGDDGYRLYIDNNLVLNQWQDQAVNTTSTVVYLDNTVHSIRFEYYEHAGLAEVHLGWKLLDFANSEAVLLAKNADAAIVCVGFNSSSEGEGADRTFELPSHQEDLINAVANVNTRTIVIVNAGGNVSTAGWLPNVKSYLQAWYPGQEGGTALAEILFGDTNPSGKLPASFEKKWSDNPVYRSYYDTTSSGKVRYSEGLFLGYRYYDSKNVDPLFPFGFGLSYTTFAYSNLRVTPESTSKIDKVNVEFDVQNTGTVAGAEVAQIYLHQVACRVSRPFKELKAFKKVFLAPGETKTISVDLDSSSVSYYKEKLEDFAYDKGEYDLLIGSSSRDIRLNGSFVITDSLSVTSISYTPANQSQITDTRPVYKIQFSAPAFYIKGKKIAIRSFADDKLIEVIDSNSVIGSGSGKISFSGTRQLIPGNRYYVETDTGAFYDRFENTIGFAGGKNEWNFEVIIDKNNATNLKLIIYPNPAADQVNIWFNLATQQSVTVNIYNLTGKLLIILPKTDYQAGDNYLNIPLPDFDNGVYLLQFKTNTEIITRKVLIHK